MAKQTILKERGTGEVLYPHTLASLVKTSSGENVEDVLFQKQEVLTTSDDLSISEDNELLLTDMAKKRLFIDMWNQAWGKYGRYDPANAPDSEHPFFGNEIWMTYEEALEIWRMSYHHCLPVIGIGAGGTKIYPKFAFGGSQTFCRTYLPIMLNAQYALIADNMFDSNSRVETILILDANNPKIILHSAIRMFSGCKKLRKIISPLIIGRLGNPQEMFAYCNSLEDVDITFTIGRHSLSFAKSAKLSLASLNTMVSKAVWDSDDSLHSLASTIIVHPDVYAKLTGDTTNAAAAALTPEELTQWQQVLTDAAEKNITFAST